jgi:2'-5' RNA ligase
MRLFLAIDLPSAVKKKIFLEAEKIRKIYPQYTWVPQENYHVTLYFFGETNKVDQIKERIKEAIWEINPFFLYSRGLDIFSNKKHVVYLNFYRQKEMEKLVDQLRMIFDPQNKNSKKFIPHLTLARGKRSSKQQFFALSKKLKLIKINTSFLVNKIILFESILTPEKPVYRKILSFPLIQTY